MRYVSDRDLPEFTDDMMRQGLAQTRQYTLLILRAGPNFSMAGAQGIIWEHGRRNFSLRAAGLLPIVCPVGDGTSVKGVGIFDAEPEEVERIIAEDPGVKSGVFTYDIHPSRSFPGASLPG